MIRLCIVGTNWWITFEKQPRNNPGLMISDLDSDKLSQYVSLSGDCMVQRKIPQLWRPRWRQPRLLENTCSDMTRPVMNTAYDYNGIQFTDWILQAFLNRYTCTKRSFSEINQDRIRSLIWAPGPWFSAWDLNRKDQVALISWRSRPDLEDYYKTLIIRITSAKQN